MGRSVVIMMFGPWSSGSCRRTRASLRGFTSGTRGSVHILETMIVGLMVVGAVVTVSTMNVPVSDTEGFKTSQEKIVQNALDAMAAQPSRDNEQVVFDSLLEEYVMKAVAGKSAPLMDYLNHTLPAGSQYNVFLDTGFGRPVPVIEGGSPPGESMTGARSFVPKLSYVFMVPEFATYQEDFHMNVLAIPMHNSILQKDEGDIVELSVTYTEVVSGETVTHRTYADTALRYNDPDGRRWASTSIYTLEGGKPGYFIDASEMLPYEHPEPEVDIFGQTVFLGDAYNITVPLVVEESAGHPIPRGAQISVEFPRGWEFSAKRQSWLENTLEGWTDFEWDGSIGEGWTIRAALKDPLKSDTIRFDLNGDYRMITDSAYPHFQPVMAWMGGGTQGKSTILVHTPQEVDVGGYRRDISLSLAKPMISNQTATWGMTLANLGDPVTGEIQIESIEIQQPQGSPLMSAVSHKEGWVSGEWASEAISRFKWTPDSPVTVDSGQAAWLAMEVKGGPTRDNHYRNHDYQELLFHFSPDNTTGGSADEWTHVQRGHHMAGEYVYRQIIPPFEEDTWPGWPDSASDYWFGAEARQQNRQSPGNSTYSVDSRAAFAQVFGDYQGEHALSRINLQDPLGEQRRTYEVGERVHVKNDFSALFGQLNTMDAQEGLSVEDIEMKSSIYTPEQAWRGIPTKTFETSAGVDVSTGSFSWLLTTDLTENGILDVIAVDSDGLVYALDGRDGSKLWRLNTNTEVRDALLSDVNADGDPELVIGDVEKTVSTYRLGLSIPEDERDLWSVSVSTSALDLPGILDTEKITAMADLSQGSGSLGEPVVAIAVSSKTGGGYVVLLKTKGEGTDNTASAGAVHLSDNPLDTNTMINGLAPVVHDLGGGNKDGYLAVASMNHTVALYSIPDMSNEWITRLPERAFQLATGDLTGDGWDDVVVNTAMLHEEENNPAVGIGDAVFVLPGRSGHFGPAIRDTGSSLAGSSRMEAGTLSNGWTAAAGDHENVLQDHSGYYNPFVGLPGLGSCNLESESGPLLVNMQMWTPDDIVSWLEGRKWTGVHTETTPGNENLYIVSRDGSVLRAHDACEDNRLHWKAVVMQSTDNNNGFIAMHAHQPDEDDGSLYRMSEHGTIQVRTGPTDWETVADACTIADLAPCAGNIQVKRWQVQDDGQGRPQRFWATVGWTDPDDETATKGHLVSVDADQLATPGSPASEAQWVHHYASSERDLHALHVEENGDLFVGGGTSDGGLFLMHRPADTGVLENHNVFYSNATKEHGGLLLDINTEGDPDWAIDEEGQAWRRASADTWVPYATWGDDTTAGALTTDPAGNTWTFMDDFDHMPLWTHSEQGTVRTDPVELEETLEAGTTFLVEVNSDEGHLGKGNEQLTDIVWYARPAGPMETGGAHEWIPLTSGGWLSDPLGIGKSTHAGELKAYADINAVELKAELNTRTNQDILGRIVQDPGSSPLLKGATVTASPSESGADPYIVTTLGADQMSSADGDTKMVSWLDGHTLSTVDPLWMYLGGKNLEVQIDGVQSRHNREVAVAAQLTSDSDGPGVAIADRSDNYLYWWALDGQGIPVRPSTGQVGLTASAEHNYLFDMLVGDLTGDGVDNLALIGDFVNPETPVTENDMIEGSETGTSYHVMLWDTEQDQWGFIESDDNHIIPAAALTGPHNGRQTVTFSVPTASLYVIPEGLAAEEDQPDFITSYFGPVLKPDGGYKDPQKRWATNPLTAQGHTTFSYQIPRNALFGTSIVVSEMRFELTSDGTTVTQTARILDWFDILPPGRSESVPPVYTVEVVSWFDEGNGQVEQRASDPDDPGGGGGGGLDVLPNPKNVN